MDAVGTLNALEAVRQSGLAGKTKFYQVCIFIFIYSEDVIYLNSTKLVVDL